MPEAFPSASKQEGPAVPQEAVVPGEEFDEEEERYQQFATAERNFFHENEMDSLAEALHGRESARAALESSERVLSGLQEDIERKRAEIDTLKSSIITRVLEFKRIRELQKEISQGEGSVDQRLKEQLEQRKKLVSYYDRLASEEEEMGKLMEEAYKMNADFDVQKELEEFEGRDVKQLAERHGVFFVHDIVDEDWKPSANNQAIDTKQLDWDEQLDLLLGLEPTISVSTIHPGTKQGTFGGGSWGVFLSGGRALGGEMGDAGTVAEGLRDRSISRNGITDVAEAISRRREYASGYVEDYKETDSSYNEIVLESPEVAGIYVKWNDEMPALQEGKVISLENANGRRYDRWWSDLSKQMERNVPLFIFDRTGDSNSVRMIYDIDVERRTFKVTSKYRPENIVDMPGIYKQHLGEVEKRKAAMRVFDKVTGALNEQELETYRPDGSERELETSPYRLY